MNGDGGFAVDLRQTEVDGVRTLWTPLPGPLRATLTFRVGAADEALPQRGLTHLVEHLAFDSIEVPTAEHHAQVNVLTTDFATFGRDEDVVAFFDTITTGLAEIELGRLENERDILKAEAATRGGSLEETMLNWRYGFLPFGRQTCEEFGLLSVDAETVRRWAAERFTRQNAVLCLTGEPPSDLRLNLSDGEWQAPPPATDLVQGTSWFVTPGTDVGVLSVLPRTPAADALSAILFRRLFVLLRRELNATYAPSTTFAWRDADSGHLWIRADAAHGRTQEVFDRITNLLLQVGAGGVPDDDLALWRRWVTSPSDPVWSRGAHLFRSGDDVLLGRAQSVNDWLAECTALTPDAVAAAAGEAYGTALFAVPDMVQLSREGWRNMHQPPDPLVPGRLFQPRLPGRDPLITVTPAAVMSEPYPRAPHRTVITFDQVVGMLCWPHGRRVVIGHDAFSVFVEPVRYKEETQVVQALDDAVSRDLHIHMPADPGPLPTAPSRKELRRFRMRVWRYTVVGFPKAFAQGLREEDVSPWWFAWFIALALIRVLTWFH